VNGSLDPWHALSVLSPLSDTESAIFIKGTAHCANMHTYDPNVYPQSMLQAQQEIAAQLQRWISA